MSKGLIEYDKDLPEIEGRAEEAHLPPTAHLRKKPGTVDEFEVIDGRRPSKLLLVNKLRREVDDWRGTYDGASETTKRLFMHWFEEERLVDDGPFRFYFGQREAIETLVYLVEVRGVLDAKDLVDSFGEVFFAEGTNQMLPGTTITHQTTPDGARKIRRWVPEVEGEIVQDLPTEGLGRYAFKMATGSGKTVVLAMSAVWSYFHKLFEPDSALSTNFLILAPNVIVYQRLAKDFADGEIFRWLNLIPSEWQARFNLKVILRGEGSEPSPSGNLILTNIQQLRDAPETQESAEDWVDVLLGKKPTGTLTQERPILDRLRGLSDLIVMNDEAHHVHDEELKWHQTLMGLHRTLTGGLSLWLDFTATPKDQNGTYFPWVICDYPLAQAVEDRIVKAPIIVHQVQREDPGDVTRDDVIEAYRDWLVAGIERLRAHEKIYRKLGVKPVLFIMAEKNAFADEIRNWLVSTRELKLKESEVLVIHTDKEGDVKSSDLKVARELARDVDLPDNPVKVIVSVLMLREGWDVRSVTTVLGLRPFTAKAGILPEQAVGRGLRLIQGISPDRTQSLEVIGTRKFEEIVLQLEAEGVGIKTTVKPPKPPMTVEPVLEKVERDIVIPLTQPIYSRNYLRLADLDPLTLDPIFDREELPEERRLEFRFKFGTIPDYEVHVEVVSQGPPPLIEDLLANITNRVVDEAALTGAFADLYPVVRTYVHQRCFGQSVTLEEETIRDALRPLEVKEAIARYLARQIGALTAERREMEFANAKFKLSATTPFTWRRDLPLLVSEKTIFNFVATYNPYERLFAEFVDQAPDVERFASLGTTEQDSGTKFRVDYIKPSGAVGFYHPDFVVVQDTPSGEVNWIVETKGRVWADTEAKDAAIRHWCERVSMLSGSPWRYVRVNQGPFEAMEPETFKELIEAIYADDGLLESQS